MVLILQFHNVIIFIINKNPPISERVFYLLYLIVSSFVI